MFIRVIQGRIRDAGVMQQKLEERAREIAPGAIGYLGSTHGATPDLEWISIVRFESAEAARRSSERPAQHTWWAGVAELLEGPARVDACPDVDVIGKGADSDAGFVQVIHGRVDDRLAFRSLLQEIAPTALDGRPHIIGTEYAWHERGFTSSVYFTSEAEARQAEQREPPPHMKRWLELVSDLSFLDLHQPIHL